MQELSQTRLKYFYEVLNSGSVRAAAERLALSPSLISRQIQLLEQEVGFTLFERRKGRLEATEVAAVIADYYRGYLSSQEYLASRLSEIKGMQRGNVKVAISEGVAEMMVHEVLMPFYASHPGVHVELMMESVNSIIDKVRTDAVHLGVCFNPPEHSEIAVLKKAEQPVGVVFRSDHALADPSRMLHLAEALRYPYAMMTADYGLRRYINLIEFQHKVKFDVALTTNSLQVLKQFVLSGAGVALMASPILWGSAMQEQTRLRHIEDVTLNAPEFCLLSRKNRPLSTAALHLIDAIKNRLSVFMSN
ncbi:LysR family transcriptional regulator [Jejubacter calystegiae]|uniref:LysR family transcriptional regulator n=1 Tax=Jejubacter calystegiae TaxID=2579935 RepID=A0A4P8YNG1_9ENTR|nr:LysR family transcriptional regulator [Jejubacter calystegiae]QCT21656.1 LysR family transcriptional regulator [Jejubacter calystegiae]